VRKSYHDHGQDSFVLTWNQLQMAKIWLKLNNDCALLVNEPGQWRIEDGMVANGQSNRGWVGRRVLARRVVDPRTNPKKKQDASWVTLITLKN
jgi:hypothetical protein